MWLSTDDGEAQFTTNALGGFDCRCSKAHREKERERERESTNPGGKALLVIGVT